MEENMSVMGKYKEMSFNFTYKSFEVRQLIWNQRIAFSLYTVNNVPHKLWKHYNVLQKQTNPIWLDIETCFLYSSMAMFVNYILFDTFLLKMLSTSPYETVWKEEGV